MGVWSRQSIRKRTLVLLSLGGILLVTVLAASCAGSGEPETISTSANAVVEPPKTDVGSPQGDASRGLALGDSAEAPAVDPAVATASGRGGDPGSLVVAERSLDRKVVSNGTIQVEVEQGRFQDAFDRAFLLADKYGGYVVSSQATGTGDQGVVRSGTVAVRVPSESFAQAMTDAGKLGELRSRQVDSQDVTEEFVDLEARLQNAQAQEKTLRDLLDRAKTIDEVLQVRQVLSSTQAEIEQMNGRLRFLDEHSSFSTVTISVFETGVEVASSGGGWGFLDALRDAARGFVATINGMVVGLAEALPVLLVLGFILWVAYRILRPILRDRFMVGIPVPRQEDERPAPPAA